MGSLRSALMVLVSFALCVPVFAQHEHHEAGAPPAKLGTVHFQNSCKPEVQEMFTRSVALLHSFWYQEADRQFRAVAEKDPSCGIAWWGTAMSLWHPLWEPNGPNADKLKLGEEAIQKAQTAGARSEREKGFIAALAKFYAKAGETPHVQRVLAYETAMEELHSKFPSDNEVTIFYALSLLGSATALPPDKTYARQRKAGSILEPLASKEPEHPGIEHYIIHAYDYPALSSRALDAARKYAKIAPDAPHALHMPSHIFTRLGLWQESIDANLASAAAARKNGLAGDELHALDYLEFAYLQTGQDKSAEEVTRHVRQATANDAARFAATYASVAIPARYVIERRQWADAAALPVSGLPGGRYSWADATVYFARALGAARSGKLDQARSDLEKIAACKKTLVDSKEDYWSSQVEIQRRAAEAWLHFASGKQDDAIAEMRSAIELDDSTDKHPVTPGSVVPMRALLGDMLLELKRPAEAQAEFSKLLESEPNRFVALFGVARSSELNNDRKVAADTYRRLLQVCARGDMDREELKRARQYLTVEAQR